MRPVVHPLDGSGANRRLLPRSANTPPGIKAVRCSALGSVGEHSFEQNPNSGAADERPWDPSTGIDEGQEGTIAGQRRVAPAQPPPMSSELDNVGSMYSPITEAEAAAAATASTAPYIPSARRSQTPSTRSTASTTSVASDESSKASGERRQQHAIGELHQCCSSAAAVRFLEECMA